MSLDDILHAFNAMLNGIKNVCGNIYGAVKSGFDKAINFVKNLAYRSYIKIDFANITRN